MSTTIRRENEKDFQIVEALIREAFWNLNVPGCDEHYLAHMLRSHPDFIPELDLVAEVDDKIVGQIMYTKSYVVAENGTRWDTLTFGPLCVLPQYQRQGIGTALINHTTALAAKRGAPAIIILGHPHNYCKHGFKNTIDYNISDSAGKFPFGQLVLELEKGALAGKSGRFYYSSAYQIDNRAAEEFDKMFPPRQKEFRYSQEEFFMAVRAYLG